MRPPRLRLRTLIALVALATLVVGGIVYSQRASQYRALAERAGALEQEALQKHTLLLRFNLPGVREEADVWAKLAKQHGGRRRAFLRAARYPWIAPPPVTDEYLPPPTIAKEKAPAGQPPAIPLD